jgi:hypothetical protein
LRYEGDDVQPVRSFCGYAVAPDDERARCSLLLTRENSGGVPDQEWRIRLVTEEGATVSGITANFGELLSSLPTNHLHAIEPNTSRAIMLTRPYPDTETNGITPRVSLGLAIVSQARGRVGAEQEGTRISLGSTNWGVLLRQGESTQRRTPGRAGEIAATQWLKSARTVEPESTNWIRFSITNVELREQDAQLWLAMDYAMDIRGDCEEVFSYRSSGFQATARKTSLLITPEDSPHVRRHRMEWQAPPSVSRSELQRFCDEAAQALVGKSFVIPEGGHRTLLRLPAGPAGELSVGIGTKLRLPAQ